MLQTILILAPGDDSGSRRDDSLDDLEAAFAQKLPADCRVQTTSSVKELTRLLRSNGARNLVVVHDRLGDGQQSGLELIPKIRRASKNVPIVVVADAGNVDAAARAVAAGASDFLVRGDRLPRRVATLLGKLSGLFKVIDRNRRLDEQNASLRDAVQARFQIVGRSPQIKRLVQQIERVAQVPRPVLITGERGTGKELVARAIHAAGRTAAGPIVVVNCAAFSDALLESELFGHEKGAFTGADAARRGKFELADGGTLFLDEIGNMSLVFQKKILRVVEYGTFTRVGGSTELSTTVRIITATNMDLPARIRDGEFLADLFDRLAFEVIDVPPLRSRRGDIAVLARHFLDQFAREIPAFAGKSLSPPALDALTRHGYPGNVRELKNIIERAAYRHTSGEITSGDLGLDSADASNGSPSRGAFEERVDAFRRRLITDALREAKNNQAEAARILGLSYHQFRYLAKRYVRDAGIKR